MPVEAPTTRTQTESRRERLAREQRQLDDALTTTRSLLGIDGPQENRKVITQILPGSADFAGQSERLTPIATSTQSANLSTALRADITKAEWTRGFRVLSVSTSPADAVAQAPAAPERIVVVDLKEATGHYKKFDKQTNVKHIV